jgi:hypothetical protein
MCACAVTGTSVCHCAGCCETFTGVEAFDYHQRLEGDRVVCVDPWTAVRRDGAAMFVRHGEAWQRNRPQRALYEWPGRI